VELRWTARFGAMQIRAVRAVRDNCVRVLARTASGEQIIDFDSASGREIDRRSVPYPLVGAHLFENGGLVGTTYHGSNGHRALLFISEQGEVVARHDGGEGQFGPAAEIGDVQVLTGRDGTLRAFRDGASIWTHEIAGPAGAAGGGQLAAVGETVSSAIEKCRSIAIEECRSEVAAARCGAI
jgi:hypothetical protein